MSRPTLPTVEPRYIDGVPINRIETIAWLGYTSREGRAVPVRPNDIAVDRDGLVSVHWRRLAGKKEWHRNFLRLDSGKPASNSVAAPGTEDPVEHLTLELRDGSIRLGISNEAVETGGLAWKRVRLARPDEYLPVDAVVTPNG